MPGRGKCGANPEMEVNSTGGQKVNIPCPIGHWMNFNAQPSV